jgi:hypothetical protein
VSTAATPRHPAKSSAEAKRQTTELAIQAAHSILDGIGLEMSPSKISRLVRRFAFRVERNGWSFFEFFTTAIRLTADQRRQALANPDVALAVSYLDPVGEEAVRRVMQAAGETS